MKVCTKCKIEKDESCFGFRKDSNKHRNECKSCRKIYIKEYEKENKNKISKYKKEYREENKDKIAKQSKKYRNENKDKILKRKKEYKKDRIKNDSNFKLRNNTSKLAFIDLKRRGGSKEGNSFFKAAGFTPRQFMNHLMGHPDKEWWMHENNQGVYRLDKWDDDDPSTWVWNVDHIIPQSEFSYISMNDPEFRKCWSLDNLRPYSAKQNILDGANRIRHKKVK